MKRRNAFTLDHDLEDDLDDDATRHVRPARRPRPPTAALARRSTVAGLLAIAVLVGLADPTPGEAPARGAAGAERMVVRSQLEQAQAALSGGEEGELEVIVTAVDFVDAVQGPGTNTAVDVFFPGGECLAEGPIDVTITSLRRARLTGELPAECAHLSGLSFVATISVDLEWTGFGLLLRIPPPPRDPADPCIIKRLERRADVVGSVTVDGPAGGLQETAEPADSESNRLASQRDLCRARPAP